MTKELQKRCYICGSLLGANPKMRTAQDGNQYVIPICSACRHLLNKIDKYKTLTPEQVEEAIHKSKMKTKLLNLIKNERDVPPKHLVRKMRIRIYNYHKLCIDRKEARHVIRKAKAEAKAKADSIAREQAIEEQDAKQV